MNAAGNAAGITDNTGQTGYPGNTSDVNTYGAGEGDWSSTRDSYGRTGDGSNAEKSQDRSDTSQQQQWGHSQQWNDDNFDDAGNKPSMGSRFMGEYCAYSFSVR